MMNSIEHALPGLALIMRGASARFWEKSPDGGFVIHVPTHGRRSQTVPHKVTDDQVCKAEEVLQTGVPPLRRELEPVPLVPTKPRVRPWKSRSSGKRRDRRR